MTDGIHSIVIRVRGTDLPSPVVTTSNGMTSFPDGEGRLGVRGERPLHGEVGRDTEFTNRAPGRVYSRSRVGGCSRGGINPKSFASTEPAPESGARRTTNPVCDGVARFHATRLLRKGCFATLTRVRLTRERSGMQSGGPAGVIARWDGERWQE